MTQNQYEPNLDQNTELEKVFLQNIKKYSIVYREMA